MVELYRFVRGISWKDVFVLVGGFSGSCFLWVWWLSIGGFMELIN